MEDHHVDRPQVHARQRAQPSGPNRPIGSTTTTNATRRESTSPHAAHIHPTPTHTTPDPTQGSGTVAWWSSRGCNTRSHPELGRETPQRPWYCRSSGGRVGRRQATSPEPSPPPHTNTNAGWSSPVARQAHNLKVTGSNPVPASPDPDLTNKPSPLATASGLSAFSKRVLATAATGA